VTATAIVKVPEIQKKTLCPCWSDLDRFSS
jgi:hypothetical protein